MTTIFSSKHLRSSVSATCIVAALMMGACGPKDKGGNPVISAETAPLCLSRLSDKVFARHFAIPNRKIDNADAQNALAALGLSESNSDELFWEQHSGSNGNYVFTNMQNTSEDGEITIEKAQFFGVRMEDGNATFDRADFEGFSLSGNGVSLKVDAMSLARPTADTAKAIIKSLENLNEDISLDFGEDAKFGFGALSMKTADITAEGLTGTIDQLVWGLDEDTQRADMKLENFDFSLLSSTSDIASVMTLKSFSARDYNFKDLAKSFVSSANGAQPSLATLLSGLNPYEKPYDSINIEGFVFDSADMNIDISKIEAQASVKGDITTIAQVLAPMTIKIKDTNINASNQIANTISQLNFDTLTFKSSQTTILDKANDTAEVKDGILDLADGFRLNYTYETSGLKVLEELGVDEDTTDIDNILNNLNINGLTLSLEDNSIVERGLGLAAQIREKDINAVKREMRAALAFAPLATRNEVEKDIVSQLGRAFMNFIDDGGTLTVQLNPPTPLALSRFENMETLSPEDVGFSARQDSKTDE
ncbi:MAG: hypothetical protein ABJG88_11690 [Litorimonas sp.]